MLPRGWITRVVGAVLAIGSLVACAGAPPAAPGPAPGPAAGTVVLMGTTDLHGWILPYDYYTGERTDHGITALAPLIDSIRAAHPGRTALVDSGDLLQGNPLNFVHRELADGEVHPLVHAMNLVGYDAAAVGNHEFNYGLDHLGRAIAGARFPWLSANAFHHGTERHAYVPFTLLRREIAGRPLTVGVTGVVPPGVHLWDRHHVEGVLEFRDKVESVRPVVAEMRRHGADVVVVASHGSFEGSSYDEATTGLAAENAAAALAREIPGIDVIFMGHSHREVADTTIAGTLLLQSKNWGASLAVAELEVAWSGERWEVLRKTGRTLRPAPGSTSPVLEAAMAEAHARTVAYVREVVGTSTAEWTSQLSRTRATAILDLINDVQQRVTGADLSSTAAFTLQSRIPEGPVTVADVAGLYVYDNTLMAVRISGADLRAYLEKSAEYYLPCPDGRCERVTNPAVPGYNFDVVRGVDYTLDVSRPVGERVVRLERHGAPVLPTDTFTLALNNYRASGAGGFHMLAGAEVVYDRGEGIRELLIEEIRRRGTITPEAVFRANWEMVPAALADRAAEEQRVSTHR
jgi:2',3'-cyclic-nucleotide 2'-phosphodiesterase (5'-nucleotidase family)